MHHVQYDPQRLEEAKKKLLDVAEKSFLSVMLSTVPPRLVPGIGSAVWVHNLQENHSEIWIDPDCVLELPKPCIEALLFHELLHHVGYNELWYRFPDGSSWARVNLALDIAIERFVATTPLAVASAELSHRLRFEPLVEQGQARNLHRAVLLLAHPVATVLDVASEPIQSLWRYFWQGPKFLSATEIYNHLRRVLPPEEVCVATLLLFPGSQACRANITKSSEGVQICLLDPQTGRKLRAILRKTKATSKSLIKRLKKEVQNHCRTWGLGPSVLRPIALDHLADVPEPTVAEARRFLVRIHQQEDPSWCTSVLRHLFPEAFCQRVAHVPYIVQPTSGELVRRALGWPALLYANRLPQKIAAIAAYVDVSGSMKHRAATVQALLRKLKQLLPSRIFVFDTGIEEVSLDDLTAGNRYWAGGGTDFNAVFLHALRQGFREAVVITDGCGRLSSGLVEETRKAGVKMNAIVLTSPTDRSTDGFNRFVEKNHARWHRWVLLET